ncbi:MAG: hypothetical protein GC159_09630 [Phycisphaera sp.]|nr:hypothetical protein [Phycisphaera sp.]
MSQATAFGGRAFSAVVKQWLEIGDQRIMLCNVGPTFIMTQTPQPVPAGPAIVAISIDGEEFRTSVIIDTAIDAETYRIRPNDAVPF